MRSSGRRHNKNKRKREGGDHSQSQLKQQTAKVHQHQQVSLLELVLVAHVDAFEQGLQPVQCTCICHPAASSVSSVSELVSHLLALKLYVYNDSTQQWDHVVKMQQLYNGCRLQAVHAGDDLSFLVASELCEPPLDAVPTISTLQSFLFEQPLHQPVPLTPTVYALLQEDPTCQPYLHRFAAYPCSTTLARVFSNVLESELQCNTAPCTQSLIDRTIVEVLTHLDDHVPTLNRQDLRWERREADLIPGAPGTSAQLERAQADGLIRASDTMRLLFKWEEQGAGRLADAVQDLKDKMPVWDPVYYGTSDYLLTLAAAGEEFQFYAVQRADVEHPMPVGPVLKLSRMGDRAQLLLACVQLFRYLAAVTEVLPATLTPVHKVIKRSHDDYGVTHVICFNPAMTVDKYIHSWSHHQRTFSITLEDMQYAYEQTRTVPTLVHSRSGPSVQEDVYHVDTEPVGISAWPSNEKQVACAVRDGLIALHGLHEAGLAHRDVRRDNFISNITKDRYYLIDLECCGRFGKPAFMLQHWDEQNTLVEGEYTAASDLYDFGVLLSRWGSFFVESDTGRAFLRLIVNVPACKQKRTASQLLAAAAAWFAEQGV